MGNRNSCEHRLWRFTNWETYFFEYSEISILVFEQSPTGFYFKYFSCQLKSLIFFQTAAWNSMKSTRTIAIILKNIFCIQLIKSWSLNSSNVLSRLVSYTPYLDNFLNSSPANINFVNDQCSSGQVAAALVILFSISSGQFPNSNIYKFTIDSSNVWKII